MLAKRPLRLLHQRIHLGRRQRQGVQPIAELLCQGRDLLNAAEIKKPRAGLASQAVSPPHHAGQRLATGQVTQIAHIRMGGQCGRVMLGQVQQAVGVSAGCWQHRQGAGPVGAVQVGQVLAQRTAAGQYRLVQRRQRGVVGVVLQRRLQRGVNHMQIALQVVKTHCWQRAAQQRGHNAGPLGVAVQRLGAVPQALCQADAHVHACAHPRFQARCRPIIKQS